MAVERAPTTIEIGLDIDDEHISLKAELFLETSESSESISRFQVSYRQNKARNWSKIENVFFEYGSYIQRQSYRKNIDRILKIESGKRTITNLELKKKIINYLNNISYYSATQFSDPSRSPVSFELEDRELIHSYGHSSVHELFLRDLHRAYEKELPFQRFMSIVGPDGLALVEDIKFTEYTLPSNTFKVLVGGTIKSIKRNKRIIVPSINIDELQLSFSQLSEGTFKTLALIFYIINDEKDLLIIEEPEVCVHHGLLSSLIELIRIQSKTKQFIISTHSDYVLDKLEPENIILVQKSKEKGTKAAPLEKVMQKNEYQHLKEYLSDSGNLGEYWKESGFDRE